MRESVLILLNDHMAPVAVVQVWLDDEVSRRQVGRDPRLRLDPSKPASAPSSEEKV